MCYDVCIFIINGPLSPSVYITLMNIFAIFFNLTAHYSSIRQHIIPIDNRFSSKYHVREVRESIWLNFKILIYTGSENQNFWDWIVAHVSPATSFQMNVSTL
ncbi:hypothetical protein ACJX0J_020540, partial [Zea mays]